MPAEAVIAEGGEPTQELMPAVHLVIEYSGLSYNEVLDLPCDTYLLMLKNATLDKLNSTQEGRDYLKKIKRLNTTEPDTEGLMNLQQQQRGA